MSYKPSTDPATTVRATSAITTQTTTVPSTAWTTIAGLSASFSSNGGPVELGLSLPLVNGSTTTCRPLVDGQPVTAGEPDNFSNFWNEGLQGVSNAGWWHMWNRVRLYRGISSGNHTIAALSA